MLLPSLLSTCFFSLFFFFNDTATTEIYTLSLHDALPISGRRRLVVLGWSVMLRRPGGRVAGEAHGRLRVQCRRLAVHNVCVGGGGYGWAHRARGLRD